MPTFGPGTLQIGEVGTEIDVSCFVNSMRITASKDESDSTTKLCGTVKPGKITYTYSLTGNVDVDSDVPDGLFALSQTAPGTEAPFTFTPSTEGVTAASGTLVIDPLDFGADEFGDDMTSDLEFSIVGAPTYAFPPDAIADPAARFKPLVINGRTGAGQKVNAAPAAAPAPAESAPVESTAKTKSAAA
jgi:hypothetical protein